MGEISGGVDKFLDLMLELQGPISKAKISDDFLWNRMDISFLQKYREAKNTLTNGASLHSAKA